MTKASLKNLGEKPKTDIKTQPQSQSEPEHVWPQILAILAGALGSFTDGVISAWTSPFILKIVQDKENYNISENEATNLTIIQPLTLALSGLFLSNICDLIGRKKVLLLFSVPHVLCLLISAFTTSIYGFYIARIFAGIAGGLLWSSMPLYIGEVASPQVRGVWGNAFTTSIFIGQFAVNIVGSYFDVTITSYIFVSIPVLFFIVFVFMPESPYYCIMKNDYESAKSALRFLKRKANVEDDFMQLKKDLERQMSESGSWKDMITIRSNRKALLAALFLRISQQLTGTSVISQYTQFIFEKSGGNVSPQIASIINAGVVFLLNLTVVIFVVDRFSRKSLYTTSIMFCSIALVALSSYFYVDEALPNIDTSAVGWLPVTIIVFYQISFSFGLGVLPTLMMGELFSASIKTKAMTVLMVALGFSNFLTNYIFNLLISFVGNYAPFLVFAGCSIVSTVLSFYVIPETKDKTLEEIQMALKQKKVSSKETIHKVELPY